jgi:hypothetical protein
MHVFGAEKRGFETRLQIRGVTHMTKATIAVATVLFAATSSAAFAQGFDPNLSNRYPILNQPYAYGYAPSGTLTGMAAAPVWLQTAPGPVYRQRYGREIGTVGSPS